MECSEFQCIIVDLRMDGTHAAVEVRDRQHSRQTIAETCRVVGDVMMMSSSMSGPFSQGAILRLRR